jgi:VWFA-related protein
MTRVSLVPILAVVAGSAAAGAWQQPQFRAGTHSVSIYATVVDDTGRLVPDLTRDDFEVFDNGVRQDLTVFANDVQPITIVIMLDRSGSMTWNFGLVRDAAEQFVGDLLPADKARLGNFSNRVEIDPETFTSDREELIRILNGNLQDGGPTPLWNATNAAMNALESQEGRRVVLVFTDGKDSPPNPTGNSTFFEVRDRSQKQEIMVYAIGLANGCGRAPEAGPVTAQAGRTSRASAAIDPGAATDVRAATASGILYQGRGLPPPHGPTIRLPLPGRIGFPPFGLPRVDPPHPLPHPVDPADSGSGCAPSKPDADLAELAEVGGGGYFELHGTDNLNATFKRIAEELHHQYLLAFTPTALDGKAHTLEVRVHQPNMTARSRKSYVAAADKH